MSNPQLNRSALKECLETLNHLFINIDRLTYEQGYEEIMGGYCELKVATLDSGKSTSKLVAAKQLRLGVRAPEPDRLAFRLARELKVWAGLRHPHVLPLLGFHLGNDYKTALLISEYMEHGDLKAFISKTKPSRNDRLYLVRDLTDGLAYLHAQNAPIRHGDLKPALTDEIPFADIQLETPLMLAIIQGKIPSGAANLSSYTQEFKFLLTNCWSSEPSQRPTAVDCLRAVEAALPSRSTPSAPSAFVPTRMANGGPNIPNGFNLGIPTQHHNPNQQQQQQPHIPPGVTSPQNSDLWNELQQRYVNQVRHTQQLNQNARQQQQPPIPPGVTSPQNGDLWNELQRRYVNQVQHTQQLNQNAIKMLDQAQAPYLQQSLQPNQLPNGNPLNMQQFRLNPQAAAAAVVAARQNQQGGAGLNPGLLGVGGGGGGPAPTGANGNPYNLATGQVPAHLRREFAALSPAKADTWIFQGPNASPSDPQQQQQQSQSGVPGLPGLGLANGGVGNGGGGGGPVEALQNQNQNSLLQFAAQRVDGLTPQQVANMNPQQQQPPAQGPPQSNGIDGAAVLEQFLNLPLEAFRNQLVNFKTKIKAIEEQRDRLLQIKTPQMIEQAQRAQAQMIALQNVMRQLTELYTRRQAMGLQQAAASGPSGQQGGQPQGMGSQASSNPVQNRPGMPQGPQDGLAAQDGLSWSQENLAPQMAQQLGRERLQAMVNARAAQQLDKRPEPTTTTRPDDRATLPPLSSSPRIVAVNHRPPSKRVLETIEDYREGKRSRFEVIE